MAEDNGRLQDKVTNPAALPVMYVTPTDTGLGNMDADLMFVSELWDRPVLERYLFHFLKYERGVLNVSSAFDSF